VACTVIGEVKANAVVAQLCGYLDAYKEGNKPLLLVVLRAIQNGCLLHETNRQTFVAGGLIPVRMLVPTLPQLSSAHPVHPKIKSNPPLPHTSCGILLPLSSLPFSALLACASVCTLLSAFFLPACLPVCPPDCLLACFSACLPP